MVENKRFKIMSTNRFVCSTEPYVLHLGTVYDTFFNKWYVCLYQALGHRVFIEEELGGPGGVFAVIRDLELHSLLFRFLDSEGVLKEPFLPTQNHKERNI